MTGIILFVVAAVIGGLLMNKTKHHHHHHQEKLTGTLLTSAGEGEFMFQVDFEPFDVKVKFTDEAPSDNPSCNPCAEDFVEILKQEYDGKWYVSVCWKVSSEREAEYTINKMVL